jgi:hypothetical protein
MSEELPTEEPQDDPGSAEPVADDSPFELPPLDVEERGRQLKMRPEKRDPTIDTEESPFAAPPVEGMPYEDGSDEDRAIQQVIREADEERIGPGGSST